MVSLIGVVMVSFALGWWCGLHSTEQLNPRICVWGVLMSVLSLSMFLLLAALPWVMFH